MAIKSSGSSLKMSEIDAEFDQGAKPWKLSKMGVDIGIAAGNKVRMSDFYGTSNYITPLQIFEAGWMKKTGGIGTTRRGYNRSSPSLGSWEYSSDGKFKDKSIQRIWTIEWGRLPASQAQVWLEFVVSGEHSRTAFTNMTIEQYSQYSSPDFIYKFSTSYENTGGKQHLSDHRYSSDTDRTTWEWRNTDEIKVPGGKSGQSSTRKYFGPDLIEANSSWGEEYKVTWK